MGSFALIAACSGPVLRGERATADRASFVRLRPPIASRIPETQVLHGEVRVDDYAWLRDKTDPKVLAYLKAENRYADVATAHTDELQRQLYQEMLGRLKQSDVTVPRRDGPFDYFVRTAEGSQYKVFCRKPAGKDGPETIVLDMNRVAQGHEFTRLGELIVSPDHRYVAYSVDHEGDERYTLRFRDLFTGEDAPEAIEGTYYSGAWASDGRTFFYTSLDEAMRSHEVYRHRVGTSTTQDRLVHHEPDDHYFLSIDRTRSGRYLLLLSKSAVTSEVRLIDAAHPRRTPRLFAPRRHGVEYYLEHSGDRFFVLTNEDALNFQVFEAPVRAFERKRWKLLIPEQEAVSLTWFDAFRDHLLVQQRANGLRELRVLRLGAKGGLSEEHRVEMPEPTYALVVEENPNFDSPIVRFDYSSLVTPLSVFDYDLEKRTLTLVREKAVIGYDRTKYETRRISARAPDGVEVPISILMPKGALGGQAPMMLEGYGAYGISIDASFDPDIFSLVDRGFIYAIAHVRGGGENGRRWKEDGKLAKKVNTFTDFIACAEHLIAERYTSADRLAIYGASAGGLLIGAVLNRRPELFRVAIAEVPFVDVVNTMLDASIPLTVIEWEEWGNPNLAEDYQAIRAYSPYDNVAPRRYPDLLVLAGLNDPRVGYWEPAKWTAKLRAMKQGDNMLLLKTNMGAGHGGPTGRYHHLEEAAFRFAFLLDRLQP